MGTAHNITFLKALLTDRAFPPIYKTITYNNIELYKNTTSEYGDCSVKLLTIKDIPDYFKLSISPSNNIKTVKLNTVKNLNGHMINLESFKNFTEYLTRKVSTKRRSNLNRYKNRLETCFNIKYVSYYGEMDKSEYDRLFSFLRKFLERRFHEKKEKNYELQYLPEFHTLCYNMIMHKKANLFVIYNNDTPISIRINMFTNHLAYYIISGYDIDYSKFHIGAIDMYKNIEWCFNNSFKIYDLLKGYDYYKKKWTTDTYLNYLHIVYDSSSIYNHFKAVTLILKESAKYRFLEKIVPKNFQNTYKKLKKFIYRYTNTIEPITEAKVAIKNNVPIENRGTEINFQKDNNYQFLKRHVYNFLFLNKENLDSISVYSIVSQPSHFVIQGKLNNQLLIIDTTPG
ncbi:GNAT family N-acetyltransferase [Tamlana sp. 2201CG12-4]|uniref:GNAT family N-acetyltransferase n=1 Tax=Tamlana sp. 2201CG12-4 TaxID=3112582 RepID=UPI002DBE023D|nr:GNAT family N-acetyltransferase [Tamlana sp. 2201CG12-4]MEC3908029.1 GNAT family N-acetyltransferase [Tamlana sp. 2201CG12-4]